MRERHRFFPDFSADNIDGDLTGSITVTGSVDTSIPEDYLISYDVMDSAGNNAITKTKTYTVAVNSIPTIDPISAISISEDGGTQTVNLSGITAGIGENQTVTVTANSNNTGLILDPTVNFTSLSSIGDLTFTPVANASGIATITVVVKDDGGTANNGLDMVIVTFDVTVNSVSDAPNIDPIDARSIEELEEVTFTVSVTDDDQITNNLIFK